MKKINVQVLLSLSCVALIFGCASGGGGGNAGGGVPGNQNTPKPKTAPVIKGNTTSSALAPSIITGVSTDTVMMAPNTSKHYKLSADHRQKINDVLAGTNQLRAAKGLAPLVLDESLIAYATARSEESVDLFKHTRLNGKGALNGTNFKKPALLGENIANGTNTNTGALATKQWKNSPPHYANMIYKDFTKVGIGYFYDPKSNRHYWTQVFGGDGAESRYSFIDPINVNIDDVKAKINTKTTYASDNKLTVTAPKDLNGVHKITLVGGHEIVLQPMDNLGFAYQTFGEIRAAGSGVPQAYLNVGKVYKMDENKNLTARYEGKSIGDLGQQGRTKADFSADVVFNSSQKTLSIELKNSKIKTAGGAFTAKNSLNFKDTLTWRSNVKQFENAEGKARLYGNDAQEIGGQFERVHNESEIYRGVYGGKRTN